MVANELCTLENQGIANGNEEERTKRRLRNLLCLNFAPRDKFFLRSIVSLHIWFGPLPQTRRNVNSSLLLRKICAHPEISGIKFLCANTALRQAINAIDKTCNCNIPHIVLDELTSKEDGEEEERININEIAIGFGGALSIIPSSFLFVGQYLVCHANLPEPFCRVGIWIFIWVKIFCGLVICTLYLRLAGVGVHTQHVVVGRLLDLCGGSFA